MCWREMRTLPLAKSPRSGMGRGRRASVEELSVTVMGGWSYGPGWTSSRGSDDPPLSANFKYIAARFGASHSSAPAVSVAARTKELNYEPCTRAGSPA
jgi:hypothetical protein